MNGISREPDDEGLDPSLLHLFDAAAAAADATRDEAFVSTMLMRLEKARRARFIARLIVTAIIMTSAAVLAPYVARVTLNVMDWLVQSLPETGMALASPIGCVCAALIAWRIARRRFS